MQGKKPVNILNQFSYPIIALSVMVIVYFVTRRRLRQGWPVTLGVQGVVALAFVAGFLLLRPGLHGVTDAEAALASVGNGRPTFVEFFSQYCSGCLAFNPIVNEIEDTIKDEYNVLRIDIHSSAGRTLRPALGFSFTPEFVLYDPGGNEVWRDHIPPTTAQIESARPAS